MKFKYHIQELGAVALTQTPTLGMAVRKRGSYSGFTAGMVSALGVNGIFAGYGLIRIFRNAVAIDSTVVDGPARVPIPFSMHGDSGSAVVTAGPGVPKFVGVLFGGGRDAGGLMTPVNEIVDRYADLKLTFDPGIGVDLNAVHTVADDAMHARQADDALAVGPLAALGERLRTTERDLAATAVGREYAELVRRNLPEALGLVNHNRRVATVWHRSGGPELMNAVLRTLRFDDEPLPREINGRPLVECIGRLAKTFARYASPEFARDIPRVVTQLVDLAGLTRPQSVE
jgi:hypothetical protein